MPRRYSATLQQCRNFLEITVIKEAHYPVLGRTMASFRNERKTNNDKLKGYQIYDCAFKQKKLHAFYKKDKEKKRNYLISQFENYKSNRFKYDREQTIAILIWCYCKLLKVSLYELESSFEKHKKDARIQREKQNPQKLNIALEVCVHTAPLLYCLTCLDYFLPDYVNFCYITKNRSLKKLDKTYLFSSDAFIVRNPITFINERSELDIYIGTDVEFEDKASGERKDSEKSPISFATLNLRRNITLTCFIQEGHFPRLASNRRNPTLKAYLEQILKHLRTLRKSVNDQPLVVFHEKNL